MKFHAEIYNFPQTDKWDLTRIQVKNMSAQDLLNILEENAPQLPQMLATGSAFQPEKMLNNYYGEVSFDALGMHLMASPKLPSARVAWGSKYWSNYSVEFKMQAVAGRSIVLMAYLWDDDNYLSTGITDNGLFLREKKDGTEKNLKTQLLNKNTKGKSNTYRLDIKNGVVNCYFNGKLVFKNVPIRLERGKVAFKIWDEKGTAIGLLQSVNISPL
jgi:hypothetical protein